MAHFSILVIGDHVEQQLAIYDEKLEVERHKDYLTDADLEQLVSEFGVDESSPDAIIERLRDWTDSEGGVDRTGYFVWSSFNPRAKWNWYIEGGRWAGYLLLKHGARGELGKPAAKLQLLGTPLLYGNRSADIALMGDIDWYGMRQARRLLAERLFDEVCARLYAGDTHARMEYGIEHGMSAEEFVEARSHPATFAVVKNSDWFARGNTGWWGVMLDATPVSEWHEQFDELMSDVTPDTLITICDAHA